MDDFSTFRRMVTPVIIQIIFWLGVVACVVAGLALLLGSGSPLAGLAILVLGPFLIRIICELLIVVFRMNETLTDIRDALLSLPKAAGIAAGAPGYAPIGAVSPPRVGMSTAAPAPPRTASSPDSVICPSCGNETPAIYAHCRSCRTLLPTASTP